MEPISFVMALAGIPAVFTSCVECYQYVQLGREFESTFEIAWCKLQAAQVRLTRWGASVGIDGPDTNLKLLWADYNEDDVKMAHQWLKEIEKAFGQALETSERYHKTHATKPEKLQCVDTDTRLAKGGMNLVALHERMRGLVGSRLKLRKRDRVSWALYRKGAFESLLESIADLTNNLLELFPATAEKQKSLCKDEVRGLDTRSLRLLKEVADDEDELLLAAISAEAAQTTTSYSQIELSGSFRGHFGDNVAPGESSGRKVYSYIKGGEQAVAHFGDNIGNYQGKMIYFYSGA